MSKENILLLEIGCEEIPSRFINDALRQMARDADLLFTENQIGYKEIKTWATPRRLVLMVTCLDEVQPALVEVKKGPLVNIAYDESGNPTKALTGFLKSQGIGTEQIEVKAINGSEYITATINRAGEKTEDLLTGLLPRLIKSISFPRPMYWIKKDVKFARPIRWLLVLYKDQPLSISYAGLLSGNITYGHRFMAPGPFSVETADQYFKILDKNFVVLDQKKRTENICDQLQKTATALGGKAVVNEALLKEVTYLVEYPVAVGGSFDPSFLKMPHEVPMTSMQHHQRYFPVVNAKTGELMPLFIGISNNNYHDNIRKGYEKVLQARLSDGQFFYSEDTKKPLEEYIDQLKSVLYMESLGTLDQKRERLVKLADVLGEKIDLSTSDRDKVKRTAHLCKADLATNLVKEFPELQGIMGKEYALLAGERPDVAIAISEHYYPRFSGDQVPSSVLGALVSLADRLDTLVGCFARGLQPTGSQDPYALRRQAQGVIQILQELKMPLLFDDFLQSGYNIFVEHFPEVEIEAIEDQLKSFLFQRIKYQLKEKEVAYDIIEAVTAVHFYTVHELFERAHYMQNMRNTNAFSEVVATYNRIANLAGKSGGKTIAEELLVEGPEKILYNKLKEIEPVVEEFTGDYDKIVKTLSSCKKPVDDFFDHVMVMVEDEKLKRNRLNMLGRIKSAFNLIADFAKIQ